MQRFFRSGPFPSSLTVSDSAFVHQVSRVMRARPGDRAEFFDASGGAEYEIVSVGKRDVELLRIREFGPDAGSPVRIALYAALPNRYEKLEYAIQKGVEVGISEFVFFPAERSQKLAITPAKVERFEAIAREALEQCGGFRPSPISFLSGWPDLPEGVPCAFLHTAAEGVSTLRQFAEAAKASVGRAERASDSVGANPTVVLLVGPEGGFSPSELARATEAGAVPVRAGERVMRTETAGVAVAFALLRMMEER